MAETRLQWHDGFHAALQIEFQEESGSLEFYSEYELYKKALRIDTLIKKRDGRQIRKKIGRIFRGYNIIEYKSPDDSLNINDFYKAYGYACLLQSNTKLVGERSMEDITITFVCSKYPRAMLKRLKAERQIVAEKVEEGIYRLNGDSVAMQIILSSKISPKENRWLSSLRTGLHMDENVERMLEDYQEHKDSILYQAAMDLIMRANKKIMGEKKMKLVYDVLKEILADEFKDEISYMEEEKSQMEERKNQFEERENQFKERENQFKERENQFKERENQFKERENQFKERESQFKEEKSQFKEEKSQFKKAQSQIKKERSQFEKEKGQLEKMENQFEEKRSQFEEKRSQFEEKRSQFEEKRSQFEEKERQANRANRMNTLIRKLFNANLFEDLRRVLEDESCLEQMCQRYGV